MGLNLVSEIWEVLREHIGPYDRAEAADTLVNYLIENNFEVEDINGAFKDKEITKALKGYADEHLIQDDALDEDFDDYEFNDDDHDDWD
jgi:hypothetical protein